MPTLVSTPSEYVATLAVLLAPRRLSVELGDEPGTWVFTYTVTSLDSGRVQLRTVILDEPEDEDDAEYTGGWHDWTEGGPRVGYHSTLGELVGAAAAAIGGTE